MGKWRQATMKVLHINLVYYPAHRYGGPIKSVHNLNKWLVKEGAEVTVYTTNIDGKGELDVSTNDLVSIDGVKVFYFPISRWLRPWFYSADFHRALKANIKNFDIIHITSVFTAASTLGSRLAVEARKPYIISPRGSLMNTPLTSRSLKKNLYLNLVEKENLRKANAIHFATEVEKKEYFAKKFPAQDNFVIPNGFDSEELNRFALPGVFRKKWKVGDDRKIILFLGRLGWIKGLDTLLPAFAEVIKKEPKTVLVLAGPDDGYKKQVELKIENCKLKIGKDVIFTGMLTNEDKIAAFQDSDIFVLPSYSESFGMSVVEAMHFGLPVIVTKGVSLAETLTANRAAVVVKKEVKDLSEAIVGLLNDGNLAKELGEKGRALAEKEFSMAVIAKKFINAYEKVLQNSLS